MVAVRSYRRTGGLWIGLLQGRRLAPDRLLSGVAKHGPGEKIGVEQQPR
jgi:hypothetical protein